MCSKQWALSIWCLSNSAMGDTAPREMLGTHGLHLPGVSAWSCRCRCYFSLQLLGAVDNQSCVSVTCMTWVWIIYRLYTRPDAEQICKPHGMSENIGKTQVLPWEMGILMVLEIWTTAVLIRAKFCYLKLQYHSGNANWFWPEFSHFQAMNILIWELAAEFSIEFQEMRF